MKKSEALLALQQTLVDRFGMKVEDKVLPPEDFRLQTVKESEVLVEQGQVSENIYFVCRGLFVARYLEATGKQLNKGFVWEAGLVAVYVSLLTQRPANFSIVALEDGTVLGLPYSRLLEFYKTYPSWDHIGRKFAEALLVSRELREYQILSMDATERYEAFLVNFNEIANRVPQYEIASYLGITPVAAAASGRSTFATLRGCRGKSENSRDYVRRGPSWGTPFLRTPWRWGYGWEKVRGYAPLSDEEVMAVQALSPSLQDFP